MVLHFTSSRLVPFTVNMSKIMKLSAINFVVNLAYACVDTIWAIYLNSFVNNPAYVGFIVSGFSLAAVISYFLLVPIIEKYDEKKLLGYSMIAAMTAYFMFAIVENYYAVLAISLFVTVFYVMRNISLGILVRDESKMKELNKNEGLISTLVNIGWLAGPLLGGFMSEQYGINRVFMLSAIFMMMAFFMLRSMNVRRIRKPKEIDQDFFRNVKSFFSNRQFVRMYILCGSSSIWWAVMFIYMPLYIIGSGLEYTWVGIFLCSIAVPLVMFEYKIGKSVNNENFHNFYIIAYLILGCIALINHFMGNVYYVMALFALGSFGMMFLEPMRDIYFFSIVPLSRSEKYYGPFKSSADMGALIGKIIGAVILLFLSYNYIFLFLSIIMFIMLGIATGINRLHKYRKL